MCRLILLTGNVSIFSRSVSFSENQRLLELVLGSSGQGFEHSKLEINEKAVISEKHVACSHLYNTKFNRQYPSL